MSDAQSPSTATQTSTLNRAWVIKMVIFTIVLLGFGAWGLYDATVAYPNRGAAFAQWAEWQFLKEAKKEGKLNTATEINDPKARYAELRGKIRNAFEETEFQWLEGLARIGALDPARTRIDGPSTRLDTLDAQWKASDQPKALAAYDLPLQWGFALIGFGGGIWVLANIVKSASKKYTWEPEVYALTLPGGRRVLPDDLADVDKKKWHKYFCALVFSDGSEPVELDVLKYTGLEEWVLTMEKVRFPDRAIEEEPAVPAEPAEPESPPAQ